MALRVDCPHCGSRPFTEFWCAGEVHPIPEGPEPDEANFQRRMRRFIVKDTAAKVIRSGARDERYYPYAPPISQAYLW